MRIKILLLILIVPMLTVAQSASLVLLGKYEKSDWISYKYFNNRVNDQLIVYRYVDSLLSVHSDKSIKLKINYYGRIFKKSAAKIEYDTTGIVDLKIHSGLGTFPKNAVSFIGNIPYQISELIIKNDKINFDDKPKITTDNNGLTTSIKTTHWLETYNYNLNNEIVNIERKFFPYNEDSTGFMTLCVSSANKWIGQYDSKGNLIFETTYWDNGNEYKASYDFENELLIKSEYVDIFKNDKQLKKYSYEKGTLKEINIYNSEQKRIGRLSYKWRIN